MNALREIVREAEDPFLSTLPDREPFFFPDPPPAVHVGPLVPMFTMTCPKCGTVWQTTRSFAVESDFCGAPGRIRGKCGARLPVPTPEIRGEA